MTAPERRERIPPEKVGIAEANPADIQTILDIRAADGHTHMVNPNHENLVRRMRGGEEFILAFVGQSPIGVGSIAVDGETGAGEIKMFSIDKSYQKKGVGEALLSWMIDDTIVRGDIRLLHMTTTFDSPAMEALLKKKKFKPGGRHDDLYGRGTHAIKWNLDLYSESEESNSDTQA